MTVNRVCGPGAQGAATAYSEVLAGVSRMMIAGGLTSRAPVSGVIASVLSLA